MIFTKLPFAKKHRKCLDFGIVFGGQNGENSKKMELKNMWFFNFDFFNFFFDFLRFWLDFGRPRALQKLKKIRKNRFVLAFRFEGGFWKGSGRVLGGFKEGFGRSLGAFWTGFGWILERFCS